MLYSLLMEAKLKFANDDSEGSFMCHEYLDGLKIIRELLSNSCHFIPSLEELKMPAVRRYISIPRCKMSTCLPDQIGSFCSLMPFWPAFMGCAMVLMVCRYSA